MRPHISRYQGLSIPLSNHPSVSRSGFQSVHLSVCPYVWRPFISPCLYFSIGLSFHLSVCLSICSFVCLPVHPSVLPSVCSSDSLFIHHLVLPNIYLCVCLSPHPSICSTIHLSIYSFNSHQHVYPPVHWSVRCTSSKIAVFGFFKPCQWQLLSMMPFGYILAHYQIGVFLC